jgi:hypothetical protein
MIDRTHACKESTIPKAVYVGFDARQINSGSTHPTQQ